MIRERIEKMKNTDEVKMTLKQPKEEENLLPMKVTFKHKSIS
jgi:hypothetical protein